VNDDDDIQQRILDAAADCFLRSGSSARLHHVIAERAGLSRPTVYKHVGDQKAIVEALLHRELDRFLTAAQPVARRQGPLRDRFINTVVFAVTYARNHALLQKMLRDEPQVVLPWLTVNATPALERVLASISPHARPHPDDSARTINPKIIAEWQARLTISLVITPSITTDLDDPRRLRRYISALLDIGLDPLPASAAVGPGQAQPATAKATRRTTMEAP
jgi:AcrR family transcriptional regulator